MRGNECVEGADWLTQFRQPVSHGTKPVGRRLIERRSCYRLNEGVDQRRSACAIPGFGAKSQFCQRD